MCCAIGGSDVKTAILFDLDGTLLDTLQDLTDATNHTLRHYGKAEKTAAEMRYIIGSGAYFQLQAAMDGRLEGLDMEEVYAYYRAYYDVHSLDKTCPYPGVVDALNTLAKKHPVGIVSNKPHAVVAELCRQFFPGVYALGEQAALRPRKPAPDMVQKALADLGADRCVYVGDTQIDVDTARNANALCLCVLWGFRDRDQLEAAGATHFCADAAQLISAIEKIMKG